MKGKETEEDVSKGDIDSAMCLEVWKSVSAEAKEQRLWSGFSVVSHLRGS